MFPRSNEQHLRYNGGSERIESERKAEGTRLQLWPVEDVT